MRLLVFASAAIAVSAAALPGLIAPYLSRPAEPTVLAAEDALRTGARTARATPRKIEIAAERDGHFYVDAEINFHPIRLMVDTGASVVALRQSDAVAAGLRPRSADFDQPVSTANGTAYAAAANLETVAVSDIEVNGVRALILPDEQLNVRLLGGSFHNRQERFQVESGT